MSAAPRLGRAPAPRPGAAPPSPELAAGYASARAVTRRHAKSFYFASRLLFGDRRRGAFALYAFCRRLDDLVDLGGGPALAERLGAARAVVSGVFSGALDEAAARAAGVFDGAELAALADTVARYRLTEAPMQELVSGLEMDLRPKHYATWPDLELYCHRVAGTVGLMMAKVLGFDGPEPAECAAALGRAMQLTNILRDLAEDLERGRCYLPQDELLRFGLDEGRLHARRLDEAFAALMALQVGRARALYRRAEQGLTYPGGFGAAATVRAMAAAYEGILDAIESRGYDVFSARAHVPLARKLELLARALWR